MMRAGFVGQLEHFPTGYRCYIVFLPSNTDLRHPSEDYVMNHFWQVANAVDFDVLFSGVARGDGRIAARRRFGINDPVEASIVILDTYPAHWAPGIDPIVSIRLNDLREERDVLELLLTLVSISHETNFFGKVKRRETFKRASEILSSLQKVAAFVKVFIP
jgi:hypothetical protein